MYSIKLFWPFYSAVYTEIHNATPYKQVCINLPSPSTSKGSLRFALPYWSTSDPMGQEHRDLICLAECTIETDCSLENKCTPALRETIFDNSVTLSKRSNETNMFQLCFSNVTENMNGTKLHIFYERSCTDLRSRGVIAVAEYVKAIALKVTGIYAQTMNKKCHICTLLIIILSFLCIDTQFLPLHPM